MLKAAIFTLLANGHENITSPFRHRLRLLSVRADKWQQLCTKFALEVGDNNIAAAYRAPAMKALAPALIFDARLLYTRENNHQDLYADAGLIAFTDITTQFELGAGLSIIAADQLASYLSALAPGAELVYRPLKMPRIKMVLNNGLATDFTRGVYLGLIWNF